MFYSYYGAGLDLDWLDRENFMQRPEKLRQLSYTLVKSIIDTGKMSGHPLVPPCLFHLVPQTDRRYQ